MTAPMPVAAPPPVPVVQPSQPFVRAAPIDLDSIEVNVDEIAAFGGRRRKRVAMIFVTLLILAVAGIVVAAMVSQAINNHSK